MDFNWFICSYQLFSYEQKREINSSLPNRTTCHQRARRTDAEPIIRRLKMRLSAFPFERYGNRLRRVTPYLSAWPCAIWKTGRTRPPSMRPLAGFRPSRPGASMPTTYSVSAGPTLCGPGAWVSARSAAPLTGAC